MNKKDDTVKNVIKLGCPYDTLIYYINGYIYFITIR